MSIRISNTQYSNLTFEGRAKKRRQREISRRLDISDIRQVKADLRNSLREKFICNMGIEGLTGIIWKQETPFAQIKRDLRELSPEKKLKALWCIIPELRLKELERETPDLSFYSSWRELKKELKGLKKLHLEFALNWSDFRKKFPNIISKIK